MRGKNEIKGTEREAGAGRDGVRETGDGRERRRSTPVGGVSTFHDSHVVLDGEREGWKERWIGYNRIFCGVCTFHESHVAFLALGNKLRVKLAAEMRNEKFKIIFRAVPHGKPF